MSTVVKTMHFSGLVKHSNHFITLKPFAGSELANMLLFTGKDLEFAIPVSGIREKLLDYLYLFKETYLEGLSKNTEVIF